MVLKWLGLFVYKRMFADTSLKKHLKTEPISKKHRHVPTELTWLWRRVSSLHVSDQIDFILGIRPSFVPPVQAEADQAQQDQCDHAT